MEVLTASQIYQKAHYQKNKEKIKARNALRKDERSVQNAKRYIKNRSDILEKTKAYALKNKPKIKIRMKAWAARNEERIVAYRREYYAKNRAEILCEMRAFRLANSKRLSAYRMNRVKSCPVEKLKLRLRVRIGKAVKRIGGSRLGKSMDFLGCSGADLKAHFESKFRDGMTWDNHGSVWHIDHIKPLSSFDLLSVEGMSSACHFTNLQPLTVFENLSKGDRT